MVEDASEVEKYFAERHIKLKRSWLLGALNFISSGKSQNRLVDLVYQQWLFADIKVSTEPIDGLRKMIDGRSFREPYILQIHALSDIGTPNLKQFKRLTDPSYEEPTEFDQPNPNPAGDRSCFSLQLSDGVVELKAFEKKRVPDLSMSTCPGSKILIYGDVELCHGYIFLSEGNCQLLGGAVEHLMHVNNVLKTLSELLNKPIPRMLDKPMPQMLDEHIPRMLDKPTQQMLDKPIPRMLDKPMPQTAPENALAQRSRKKKSETPPPATPQQKKMRQSEDAAVIPAEVSSSSSLARNYVAKATSSSDFAPEGPPPSVGEEDDAELFGRRVVKFLRSLSSARRRRQACIGFEHVMIQFEEEEEDRRESAIGTFNKF